MFRTDCKKFYNLHRQKNANVKNAPNKEEIQNLWKAYMGKMFNTMMKPKGSKTTTNKILVRNGSQYLIKEVAMVLKQCSIEELLEEAK
jgi:hypothetical protein